MQGFRHQAEFTVFQVADAAVQELKGSAAGVGDDRIAFIEFNSMASSSQFPANAKAIDAGAKNCNIHAKLTAVLDWGYPGRMLSQTLNG